MDRIGRLSRIMRRFGSGGFMKLEEALTDREGVIKPPRDAPERFDFIPRDGQPGMGFSLNLGMIHAMMLIMRPMRENMRLSFTSLGDNPEQPETRTGEGFV